MNKNNALLSELLGSSFVGYLVFQEEPETFRPNIPTSILGLKVSPMEMIGSAEWEGYGFTDWSNTQVYRNLDKHCYKQSKNKRNRLSRLDVTMMSAWIQGFDSHFRDILPFGNVWKEQEYDLIILAGKAYLNDNSEHNVVGLFPVHPGDSFSYIREQAFAQQQNRKITIQLTRAELAEICSYLPGDLSKKLSRI